MYATPILAARTLPIGADGAAVPLYFAVEGGLHFMRGNSAPYFTLTYTQHRSGHPNQCQSGGAGHDAIARWFGDRFADLAALHLSDINGVPMHAEANGWYQLAGALGGAGERYHAGNGDSQHWGPMDPDTGLVPFLGFRPSTPAECLAAFARHCRIALDQAEAIRAEASAEYAANPDGWPAARATMALRLDDMRPRWMAEAEAAIERHHLRVFGDPWPPVAAHEAIAAG